MKSITQLPKTLVPTIPELDLNSQEGTPGYGEDGPPTEEQAAVDALVITAQYRADVGLAKARYTGGNIYDFINAQSTL